MARLTCALGPDAAGTLLGARIEAARDRIEAAVYEVSVYYAFLLRRAAQAGADVRVLLDDHGGANTGTAAALGAGAVGGMCRVLPSRFGAEAHWKLLAVDGCVCVGTGNLLHRDAPRDPRGAVPPAPVSAGPGTREWWALIDDCPPLLSRAYAAFDERWMTASSPATTWRTTRAQGVIPPVGVPLPLIAPLTVDVDEGALGLVVGGTRVGELLADRLAATRRRALVTIPYVHANPPAVSRLIALLAAAASRGADVRMLLGGDGESSGVSTITAAGVNVRVMDPAKSTTGHAKGVVADATAVVTSSNWSAAGLGGNLETALAIADERVADYFGAAFEHDWGSARPAA